MAGLSREALTKQRQGQRVLRRVWCRSCAWTGRREASNGEHLLTAKPCPRCGSDVSKYKPNTLLAALRASVADVKEAMAGLAEQAGIDTTVCELCEQPLDDSEP